MNDTRPVTIDTVEQVTLGTAEPLPTHIPYVGVLAAVTAVILIGFGAVTFWVLRSTGQGIDAATKGALIQTWNNLALLAAGFWLGSSVAGKMQNGKRP